MSSTFKHPSAWVPVALSLAVLGASVIAFTLHGQPDEGVAAHLFQMWLVLEVLMITFFVVKWLPRAPKQALMVLVIQILAVLAACAPVAYSKL